MACQLNFSVAAKPKPQPCVCPSSSAKHPRLLSSQLSSISGTTTPSLLRDETLIRHRVRQNLSRNAPNSMVNLDFEHEQVVSCAKKPEPMKMMISGAPASGKGTQCEFITKKYGLVHVAAGDLLRKEVAAGSENGRRAREYMEKGQLVPDEIVVMMVKDRLLQPDSQENGWLLDGYPRSSSQAIALMELGFRPDLFILLDVPEEIVVERVVGRRLDPLTGRIYHLKYFPPETEEIAARLTQRFDDTEEKVKLRLNTHHKNVEAVLSMYKDITVKVNGGVSKEDVFAQIDGALTELLERRRDCLGVLQ
ncbi:adenylate kinase, chloroplastic isoform X2 [Malania oleifera]|uniref:adenylate kinase, chloroplastic isoform X2 n=1 Tax=Malania oleifera TaxID=397392 RepID=UPI0025AE6DC4|nr:adenylate kinase, chloroplastic isoform X2 [Malania oleifera]